MTFSKGMIPYENTFYDHVCVNYLITFMSITEEQLKARLVQVSEARSRDAMVGVERSPLQDFAERSTVGAFDREELLDDKVVDYLADPSKVLIVTCGRNEAQRGNLGPLLDHINESTNRAGNAIYCDADSTDDSINVARSRGIEAKKRSEVVADHIDTKALADILGVPPHVIEGKPDSRYTPMRKGMDILVARIEMFRRAMEGTLPPHVFLIDSDLKSIPGGAVGDHLPPNEVYLPLHQMARAHLEYQKLQGDQLPIHGIYTSSGGRNNEPVFSTYNEFAVAATSPWTPDYGKHIALAFHTFPGSIGHILTGELSIYTGAQYGMPGALNPNGSELFAMGATGQCVETARTMSQAGFLAEVYDTSDPSQLIDAPILLGNVRRGEQKRIDEPQIDDKEWLMIAGQIPQFARGVGDYCIHMGKLPHELTLEDYQILNGYLGNVGSSSFMDSKSQTRQWKETPAERAIPPVALLAHAGIIKV